MENYLLGLTDIENYLLGLTDMENYLERFDSLNKLITIVIL